MMKDKGRKEGRWEGGMKKGEDGKDIILGLHERDEKNDKDK